MTSLLATYGGIDAARDIICLAVGFGAGQVWCVVRERRRR
jgi:hypothetical protein